jgi:hypothetical protein
LLLPARIITGLCLFLVSQYATLNVICKRCYVYPDGGTSHALGYLCIPGQIVDGEMDGKPFTTLPKNLYCEIKRIAIFFKISLQKSTNLHRFLMTTFMEMVPCTMGSLLQLFSISCCICVGRNGGAKRNRSQYFSAHFYQAKVLFP